MLILLIFELPTFSKEFDVIDTADIFKAFNEHTCNPNYYLYFYILIIRFWTESPISFIPLIS